MNARIGGWLRWLWLGAALAGLAGCSKSDHTSGDAGPYCDVVSQFVSKEDCDALQAQAGHESQGAAAFNAPNPMHRGDKATVWLAIADTPPPAPVQHTLAHHAAIRSLARPAADIAPSAEPAASDAAAASSTASADAGSASDEPPAKATAPAPDQVVAAMPGHTEKFTLTVGPHMAADLNGDNGFDVKQTTPRRQLVHLGAPYPSTLWSWDVTALHGGTHVLTMTTVVEAVGPDGKYYPLVSTPTAYSFIVTVSPLDQIKDAIETAPGWIKALTAVVAALTALVTAVVALRAAMKKGGPGAGGK